MNYKIYKYTNKTNGKVYIGQTKRTLQERAGKNGNKYSHCPYFWRAIQKYGWENFIVEILANNLTQEEANILEKKFISEYDSRNPDKGYNINIGGEDIFLTGEQISELNKLRWQKGIYDKIKNGVYCVELDRSFSSALEAERITGIDNSGIQKACKGKNRYAGIKQGQPLHWLFIQDVNEQKLIELHNRPEQIKGIGIPIECIELNQVFQSAKEASVFINRDESSIRKAVKKGTTCANYHWKERTDLLNVGKFKEVI